MLRNVQQNLDVVLSPIVALRIQLGVRTLVDTATGSPKASAPQQRMYLALGKQDVTKAMTHL